MKVQRRVWSICTYAHYVTLLIVRSYVCGCASNPWSVQFQPPVQVRWVQNRCKNQSVLLAPFTTGSGVDARWTDIGPDMQKAFARALLKSGKFEVVYNRSLPPKRRESAFQIEAKITDFLHSPAMRPRTSRRLSWFTQANDAIVAMDITATAGAIWARRVFRSSCIDCLFRQEKKSTDPYGSLEFGSYLFWSTPLGEASAQKLLHESVSQNSQMYADLRPRWDSNPRITDLQSVPLVHLGTRP